MGTPADYLPQPIADGDINRLLVSLGLPRADRIQRATVTAEYHGVYLLTMPPDSPAKYPELVLRVSGHHLPRIKTENEVGVMSWVSRNTNIPIPALVAYDSTTANPTRHEYTLLERVPGETLSDIYSYLDDAEMDSILDQLIDMLSELHSHEFSAIGGLNIRSEPALTVVSRPSSKGDGGDIHVTRIVDETFWMAPEIKKLWPEGETVDSLNLGGPYSTYADLISAQVQTYIKLIRTHDKLGFMRDALPQLEHFVDEVRAVPEVNDVKLCLAHKDLHFANILFSRESGRITAILDWEFSGVVPLPLWDPRRAFLWNGHGGDDSLEEKQRLRDRFHRRCTERGVSTFQDAEFTSPLQEIIQKATNYLRAITEVAPRDQRKDLVAGWREVVLENIALF